MIHKRPITICLFVGMAIMLLPFVIHMQSYFWRVASLFMLALVIAAGLHLITGMAKVISLCHIALCGVGAYAAGKISLAAGLPPFFSILVGAAASGTVAILLAWVTLSLEDLYLTLATLAASEILSNLFRSWTNITGGANGLIGIPPLSISHISFQTPERYFVICTLAAVVAISLVLFLENSALGKCLRAVGDAEVLVESLGLRRDILRLLVFAIGGTLAGFAGAISAHIDGFVGPESFGVGQSVSFLCYLVIGGMSRLRSVFVAGIFAVFVSELLRQFQGWQMVIVATLATIVLLWESRGGSVKPITRFFCPKGTQSELV